MSFDHPDSHPDNQGPEILEPFGGQPAEPTAGAPRRRRVGLIAAGAVAGVALLGGAAWAAAWYLSSGPQAAEALPADTLGYLEVNLDPSGEQKIEALDVLEKFPAFEDELDPSDDLRETIWNWIQDQDDACTEIDYADDIEPWLGNRMAMAAVLVDGEPVPVGVVEVTDEGKAESGLRTLLDCGDEGFDGGLAVTGGWALFTEEEADLDTVVADAEQGTLADDEDFQKWLDEAGDDGIITGYAAPEAAEAIADLDEAMSESDAEALREFQGGALKVRFADSSVEAEYAGDFGDLAGADTWANGTGGTAVATLPEDTAFAFGMGFEPGWLTAVVENFAPEGESADDLFAEAERETGLDLPEDVETLLGESAALAMSGDVDVEGLVNSANPYDLPIAVKVKGDADAIEAVLEKLRSSAPELARFIRSESDGDYVAFGPSDGYVSSVVADGGLGDSETYTRVVPESERAAGVQYVDFDAADDWLVRLLEQADAPADVVDNVRPFQAVGVSSWMDGDVTRGLVKVTFE